jgi:trans-aconitate methyltransferase
VTRPPDFEARYVDEGDPWHVETSWYERRKLRVLLASLPKERYRSAWEPGCGIGVATEALAARVDSLVATDPSPSAIEKTAARVQGYPHVGARVSALPSAAVPKPVELVVVAEFLYYLEDPASALEVLWDSCAPGAHLVLLHWAHHPHDAYRSGEQTHRDVAAFTEERGATRVVAHLDADFRLDIYEVPA